MVVKLNASILYQGCQVILSEIRNDIFKSRDLVEEVSQYFPFYIIFCLYCFLVFFFFEKKKRLIR